MADGALETLTAAVEEDTTALVQNTAALEELTKQIPTLDSSGVVTKYITDETSFSDHSLFFESIVAAPGTLIYLKIDRTGAQKIGLIVPPSGVLVLGFAVPDGIDQIWIPGEQHGMSLLLTYRT